MSSITEFLEKEKPSGYTGKMLKELSKLNEELNAFNNIADSLGSGMPFSVKDNICVKGIETTASSRMLEGYIPAFNATVVQRMLDSGFSFIGKTNMDEFGFGSFGLNSTKPARNPFDVRYVAGGSSSGAAVATSILKYHVAIAESTGGSISTPAAFCGVVGFTPTYGALSRYGLIDYANSLDKIGIMARHADDVRSVFDKVRGADAKDTTSIEGEYRREVSKKIILPDQLTKGIDEDVESGFARLVEKLEGMGYKTVHRSIPFIDKAIPAYYTIAMAEASTNLARYSGFKYGYRNEDFTQHYNQFFTNARERFGLEAKRRIVLGTFVRSASVRDEYYSKALKVRRLLIKELGKALQDGFILSPVMPIKVPTFEEVKELTALENYKMDVMTIPPNLCGLPHVSFPYAYHKGMPLAAQLVAGHWGDHAVLGIVEEWERHFDYKFKYNIGEL
ncbi:MAG: amidase family protein [Candidatus Marsarchaeota archaeon]|nr:amidase family protein [Candidatus Marsarchaeota archaeon]